MFNRRTVLLSLLGLGVGGGSAYLFRTNHTIPKPDAAAEQRFRDLQDRLFARYGVATVSHFYQTANPPLRVHVIEAGRGEPALFLHGGNSVAAGWVTLIAKLHQDVRVLAPDRPGCGLTTKFNYLGVPLRAHAVAFVDAVMNALQLSRASIVGNSMGGYLGWSSRLRILIAFASSSSLANPREAHRRSAWRTVSSARA
jgi:pimeloyl-ACP methyl ester carboxylesterase